MFDRKKRRPAKTSLPFSKYYFPLDVTFGCKTDIKPLQFEFFADIRTKVLRKVFWEIIVNQEKMPINRINFVELLVEFKRSQTDNPDKNISGAVREENLLVINITVFYHILEHKLGCA